MGIKELYQKGEDQWYQLLDGIETKIPVYRVIDPIDKVVPSFGLICAGVVALFLLTLLAFGASGSETILSFRDEQGNPVQGVEVTIAYGTISVERMTDETGKIVLKGISNGTTLLVSGNDSQYESFSYEKIVEARTALTFTLALKTIPSSPLTFHIVDETGLSLSGKNVYIQMECTSGATLPQTDYTILQGIITVTPPSGCEKIVGVVNADGYTQKEGVVFDAQNPVITLNPVYVGKGTVKVTVQADTAAPLGGMAVELFSQEGLSSGVSVTNTLGVSLFEGVAVGEYYISVTDPAGNWAILTSDPISVIDKKTESITLSLSKKVQGAIRVSVTDKLTGAKISNVMVKIVEQVTNKVLSTQTTNGENDVVFPTTAKGPFVITAYHSSYLGETAMVTEFSGEKLVDLALEPLTGSNFGKITINVQDEEGILVDNAQVVLYHAGSGFIAHEHPPQITNSKGEAFFVGVQSGNYFARAMKFPAGPSDSTSFTTDKSIPAQHSLVLKIGKSTVRVEVKDVEGKPVPFATVEFQTDGTDECGEGECEIHTDASGIATKPFKADKKVYVTVSAPGYASFQTLSYQLYPGKNETILVTLPTPILGSHPTIQLVDVKDPVTGMSATEIKNGKTYFALFQLQIPTSLSGGSGGFHVRVGEQELLENDALEITGVNAPGAWIVKGTTYTPPIGYAQDEENLTSGNAKWVNAEWNSLQGGVYLVGVSIRPSEKNPPLKALPLHYRSWMVSGEKWLRDPMDSALGTSDSTSGKNGQYAEAYEKVYYSGKPMVCDESFCYSGETVYNQDNELLVNGPPYSLSPNKNYNYSFVITSQSPAVFGNVKMRAFISSDTHVPSEEAVITAYSLTQANGQGVSDGGLLTNDVLGNDGKGIEVGTLNQYQSLSGTFTIVPKETATTHLVIQLMSEGDVVFEHITSLEQGGGKILNVSVTPTNITAFVSTSLMVQVEDEDGFAVPGAQLILKKVDSSQNAYVVSTQLTDGSGKAELTAPSSLPGTKFILEAGKGGYVSAITTLNVEAKVVTFSPEQLLFSLPNSPSTDQFLPLNMTNVTQAAVSISNTSLSGDFQGLLANGEMENYVKKYVGVTTVGVQQTKTIQVKASTTQTMNALENKELKGNLVLSFKGNDSPQEWVQSVPLTIGIKLVEECEEGGIQLTGEPGKGIIHSNVFGTKTQIPFQLLNTCHVAGKPFALKNLKAKLVWKSAPMGNVELALTETAGQTTAIEVLKNGAFVPLLSSLKVSEDSVYEGVLTFTPHANLIGETADFTITIAAESGGIGSSAGIISETFTAKLLITNLQTCVKITPDPEAGIHMQGDETKTSFQIDASGCGVPVDVAFCTGTNNENCRGGAPEGKLYLSQSPIMGLTGTHSIIIERKGDTLPGTYDLTVDARISGTSYQRIAAINTEIEPNEKYVLQLDKSSFNAYKKGSKDASSVEHSWFVENVSVKASVCDWDDSQKGPKGTLGWAKLYFSPQFLYPLQHISIFLDFLSGEDPCDDDHTGTLQDYVINLAGEEADGLAPDALEVKLSPNLSTHFSTNWALENRSVADGEEEGVIVETVGIELENKEGYTNPIPVFGVMSLVATEHRHGDDSHTGNAKVNCNSGSFGAFRIGPNGYEGSCPAAENVVREEKYHIKIKTKDVENNLPTLTFDSVACSADGILGATGKDALPRVAFNWNWNDTTGIPLDACDASNGNAIYCDATQFNIVLMKRLHALDEFLAANEHQFDCPESAGAQQLEAHFPATSPIPTNAIGFSSVGYAFSPQSATTVTFSADIANNSAQEQTLSVHFNPGSGNAQDVVPSTCIKPLSIPANGTAHIECTIAGFGLSNNYYMEYEIVGAQNVNVSFSHPIISFNTESVSAQTSGSCAAIPKTTAFVGSAPGINIWIDPTDPNFGSYVNESTVTFTPSVPNVQALNSLLHFEAYLIQDAYSADFQMDFRNYYVNSSFADAPFWFKGNENGLPSLSQYYGSGKLAFTQKYFEDVTLPAAGKYHVDIEATFGEQWNLFDEGGSPSAPIAVKFYHMENPFSDSPFYRLPFDGLVGLENTTFNRIGYGMDYINAPSSVPIKLNNGDVQTYLGGVSSGFTSLTTQTKNDLRTLNSLPSSRGVLLEISVNPDTGEGEMVFSPSIATPILMRVTHAVSPTPFSTFYQIHEGQAPVETGDTLTFWEGAGSCYDFTGIPVYEKFNFSPDRAALPIDNLQTWQYAYGVDWEHAVESGTTHLRTIFYTPPQSTFSFETLSSGSTLISSNDASPTPTKILDGIVTLPYNNPSLNVDSVQDLFDLVANEKVCVSDSGVTARFFWNPAAIYQHPSQTSISVETNGLVAGETCIGIPE